MGITRFRLLDATLRPPALSVDDKDAAAGELSWVLLELQAYVSKLENATTARSKTWDGKEIQVTFCRRRPPRLSYLAVYSRDAEIPVEPQILATEDDIVLLRVVVSCQKDVLKNLDYYIYRADDGSGRPSLDHLPRPPSPYFFDARNIGILRRPTDYSSLFLRPHRSDSDSIADEYIVAGLHMALDELHEEFEEGTFILSRFDSKMKAWTTNTVSLNHQQKQQYRNHFEHSNSKVIAIGGDAGTMAFLDLWRGILFCDVLPAQGQAIPPLRYVPLPSILPKSKFSGDARLARDIAVVQGGRDDQVR
uniref:Uncharacterized protein n=1 Tax=Arundo donax TaxID=35708 RepID=A0A0A9SIU7_ARUDO